MFNKEWFTNKKEIIVIVISFIEIFLIPYYYCESLLISAAIALPVAIGVELSLKKSPEIIQRIAILITVIGAAYGFMIDKWLGLIACLLFVPGYKALEGYDTCHL